MPSNLKELKSVHRQVARRIALQFPLREICMAMNLKHETWLGITQAPLFKEAVERIELEIQAAEIDDHINDRTLAKIKQERYNSVTRIVAERDNMDKEFLGATAATRIRAAEDMLKLSGDMDKEPDTKNVIILNLAKSTLDDIESTKPLTSMPDNFTLTDFKAGEQVTIESTKPVTSRLKQLQEA